jgi:hypothetical protein
LDPLLKKGFAVFAECIKMQFTAEQRAALEDIRESAAFWRDVIAIMRAELHRRGMTDAQIDNELRTRPAPRTRRTRGAMSRQL